MGASTIEAEQDLSRLYGELIAPLYDPLGKAEPEELGSFLLFIYPVDELDTYEFVAEAATDAYTSLPFEKGDLLEIARGLGAREIALRNLTEVDRRTDAHVDELFATLPDEVRPGREFLAVCMSLQVEAHQESARATGRPYDMHPLEAAAMTYHVLEILKGRGHNIDETSEDLAIAEALAHDIVEEGIGKEGMYFDLSRNRNYHPLLLKRIMERAEGPIAERAMEGAMALEHLTHVKSRPWMREYTKDYIRGRVCSMPAAIVPKMSEMQGNIIEPHPDKPVNMKYVDAMPIMETALARHLEQQGQSWGHEYAEVLRTIKKEDLPVLVHNLRDYIYDLSNYVDDLAA